ncbi:MAG TPA: Stp1/IreP family PP2C-type Ser/Thr phosphatase [Anaerolineae bacterium]
MDKRFQIGKHSDVGRVRDLNEDAFGTADTFHIAEELQNEHGTLIAVADGMGGHAAGEVASQEAIQVLFESFYSQTNRDPGKALLAAIHQANDHIYQIACNDCEKTSMGTTVVAAVLKDNRVHVANVGDSRAYLIRGENVRQITHDHSWVAEQVRARLMSQEEAERHVYKNVITRAVGSNVQVHIDSFREGLKSRDSILLCTDGLSNKVNAIEIASILDVIPDPEAAAQEMVHLANERGGEDNITAVIARVR